MNIIELMEFLMHMLSFGIYDFLICFYFNLFSSSIDHALFLPKMWTFTKKFDIDVLLLKSSEIKKNLWTFSFYKEIQTKGK